MPENKYMCQRCGKKPHTVGVQIWDSDITDKIEWWCDDCYSIITKSIEEYEVEHNVQTGLVHNDNTGKPEPTAPQTLELPKEGKTDTSE